MFGMAGGSAGQFVVGPLISSGVSWSTFWLAMGCAGLVIAVLLFFLIPSEAPRSTPAEGWKSIALAFGAVFRNPQSILCGLISGLLFIPTTVFDMIWGVRYLQEAHGLDYGDAVMRSATIPFGWIIGCPLLGFISDRIGRRRPVIIGGAFVLLLLMAWALYGKPDVFPPYIIGVAMGIASGAAMLPYTIIKEANPPQYGGTATGVVNFLNFTFSALLGPVFGWRFMKASGGVSPGTHADYQSTFSPLLVGVLIAIILAWILKETGPAARRPPGAPLRTRRSI
jgi:sugar phosphate permease